MDRARGFATKLQALGCRFALDHFGAGFGSFYYLKHIPFDYVKIDGEFIRNLPASSTDQLILDSIVQMSMGSASTPLPSSSATRRPSRLLKDSRVDYAQGFSLGKPRPVSEALSL
jgi:EAL domain-containing protein (putative c-di-GMP-specific phosphodiesterase class I)